MFLLLHNALCILKSWQKDRPPVNAVKGGKSMRYIISEYGEAVVGTIAAIIIIGVGVLLFTGGGVVDSFFSELANKAI